MQSNDINDSLQQYQSVHSQYTLSNETIYGEVLHAPFDFYSNTIERLENRLEKNIYEIEQVSLSFHLLLNYSFICIIQLCDLIFLLIIKVSQQLQLTHNDFMNEYQQSNQNHNQLQLYQSSGVFSHRQRIGTSELIELVQNQYQLFLQITATVAETHELCDRMRESYLDQLKWNNRGRDANPFKAEDKRIAAENRQQNRRGNFFLLRLIYEWIFITLNIAMQPVEGMTQSNPQANGMTNGNNFGFGGAPTANNLSGNGFGATSNTSFGSFASPNKSGFGTSAGFGSNNFGKTSGFSTNPTGGNGFGQSTALGSPGFGKTGTSATIGFGSANSGFGNTNTNANGGFGFGTAAPAGGGNTNATTQVGFGSMGGSTFGTTAGFGSTGGFGTGGGAGFGSTSSPTLGFKTSTVSGPVGGGGFGMSGGFGTSAGISNFGNGNKSTSKKKSTKK